MCFCIAAGMMITATLARSIPMLGLVAFVLLLGILLRRQDKKAARAALAFIDLRPPFLRASERSSSSSMTMARSSLDAGRRKSAISYRKSCRHTSPQSISETGAATSAPPPEKAVGRVARSGASPTSEITADRPKKRPERAPAGFLASGANSRTDPS